ncbi:unnamed protein product, partial [marine sediment metagenome]
MSHTTRSEHWLPRFRRALGYLRPHRRTLVLGLLAAVGVSVFYTFSISSVIPILKIMFSDHETLVDWLHRVETEHRLGVSIGADLPDDPAGLLIDHVRRGAPSADVLADGARIVSIAGEAPGAHALMGLLASHPDERIDAVRIQTPDGAMRDVALTLHGDRAWWRLLRNVAAVFPAGKDPTSRLITLAIVMGLLVTVSLLSSLCRFANEGLVATAVQRTMHDLRSSLAGHVLHLPLDWHARQPTGDTLGRFAHDLSRVEVGI